MNRPCRIVLPALLLAASGCTAATNEVPPASPTATVTPALARAAARLPQLAPCTLPGVHETVLCGELRRPENPDRPDGRSIPVFVVVVPALSPTPQPTPYVELQGGPGNAATDIVRRFTEEPLRAYRQDRDVLLVDQRGMGRSNGLFCEELALYRVSSLFPRWPVDSVAPCRERLSRVADLSQYGTDRAADDLDAVRAWLGYPQLDLFSYSYGTRAALVYMRRYPRRVRSAILWGVVPPDFRRPVYYARDAQVAMDRLLADCAADAPCARAFPRVREELAQVMERLDRAPVPVTLTHPSTGQPLPASITRAGLAEGLWQAQFYPDRARRLPMVIHEAARGNFNPFLEMDVAKRPPRRPYYNAAHLSIICPEETRHIRAEEVEPLHRGTFMPAERTWQYMRACEEWGVPALPASILEPVRSDVPTLIVSGWLDHVTPPSWGDSAARHLSNSRHLVIRHLAHEADGVSNPECLDALFLRFIANPDPAALDVACVEAMSPPAFVLGLETAR